MGNFCKHIRELGIIHPLLLLTVFGVLLYLVVIGFAPLKSTFLATYFPKDPAAAANTFLDTFDGSPATPQPFLADATSRNWDVAVQSRDSTTWELLEPMNAHHGPDCAPPLDSAGNLVTHQHSGNYSEAVFKCKDHLMTSIKAGGYGVIYLTPNQLIDFGDSEVVVKIDVTTLRTSERDWWDIWITPFEDNLQLPFAMGDVDLNGVPRNAVHISNEGSANGNGTGFMPKIYKDFNETADFRSFSGDYNWWTGYESFMKTSPQKRTTFELRLSKTHLKFCIPGGQVDQDGKAINGGSEFCWVDKDISPLSWSKGVVQFGHHSYNPQKDCTADGSMKTCYPNTWHWDTVSLSNATPFTLIKADTRMIDGSSGNNTVTFNAPAPENAYMRFSAIGKVEYSVNGGVSWHVAPKQASSTLNKSSYHFEHLTSYFVPIAVNTQKVQFRFSPDSWYTGPYQAKDFAIWSLTPSASSGGGVPTTTPEATALPTMSPTIPSVIPTTTPLPTVLPTLLPTPSSTPVPTVVPTAVPNSGSTIVIHAAGQSARQIAPVVKLQLYNSKTKKWESVRDFSVTGDPYGRVFQQLSYTSAYKVGRSQVRVRFSNDYSRNGEDRNVLIDKVVIDGVSYETESTTTYSVGSWGGRNGCGAGFKASEWLHCNGYFEYR